MFDDHPSRPAELSEEHLQVGERRRVFRHADEHGPLPVAGLQADLFPSEPARFARVLSVLIREGVLRVERGTVEAAVDPTALGDPETVALPEVTVTFRPARGRDFRDLVALVRSVAGDTSHPGLAAVGRELVADGRIHRWDDGVDRIVYVAGIDGRLGGWIHLSAVPGRDRAVAQLAGGVAERFRGEGVGSRFLHYALAQPRTREFHQVYQHIPAHDDDAFQFLRMNGWRVDGSRTHADGDGDGNELRVVQDVRR